MANKHKVNIERKSKTMNLNSILNKQQRKEQLSNEEEEKKENTILKHLENKVIKTFISSNSLEHPHHYQN